VGEAEACGGDALMRVGPLQQVGGFRASLIAGEEPELCLRLRSADWKIVRVGAEMTLHDAAMTRFRQWWRRAVRVRTYPVGWPRLGRAAVARGAIGPRIVAANLMLE
jgi:GT2 family glycosyltransferase